VIIFIVLLLALARNPRCDFLLFVAGVITIIAHISVIASKKFSSNEHAIEDGYEPFHLTGTQGIIGEIDDYVRLMFALTLISDMI
jgi:hypothetical protein